MPLTAYRCQCGHEYEELEANGYKPDYCPKCKSQSRTPVPSSFGFGGFQNEHLMDPLEKQAVIANRKMHEDLILSGSRDLGEYMVKEKGPDWTRPFGNDSFERKKAIEEHNADIQPGTD